MNLDEDAMLLTETEQAAIITAIDRACDREEVRGQQRELMLDWALYAYEDVKRLREWMLGQLELVSITDEELPQFKTKEPDEHC